jgi:hypothetical protein
MVRILPKCLLHDKNSGSLIIFTKQANFNLHSTYKKLIIKLIDF